MENSQERLIRYLQDAHAAEAGIQNMLDGFIDDSNDPDVQDAIREHLRVTESQANRLEARLKELGSAPSGSKGFFNSLMAKLSEMMHGMHDEYDKTTMNLIKAYATEHLERGMYESLLAYSRAIGDMQTANLALDIQAEEEAAAQRIFPMIARCATSVLQSTKV